MRTVLLNKDVRIIILNIHMVCVRLSKNDFFWVLTRGVRRGGSRPVIEKGILMLSSSIWQRQKWRETAAESLLDRIFSFGLLVIFVVESIAHPEMSC